MTTITVTRTYTVSQVRRNLFTCSGTDIAFRNPICEICEHPFKVGDALGLVHVNNAANMHLCDPCTVYIMAKMEREAN
jgi:hypothetical protein